MKKKLSPIDIIYSCLIFVFLYAPIAVLIIYSFNASKSRGTWGGFSLKWYAELFSNSDIMQALITTLTIAVISAAVSVSVAGFVGASYNIA